MSLEGMYVGRYHLMQVIGRGSMGEVYLAKDTQLNRQVAIKIAQVEASIYSPPLAVKEAARLFLREAKAIAQLDHPNILTLFDYGEETLNGITFNYMVMPYRQEGSFADWMRQRRNVGLLSRREVAYFLEQAAEALEHAHKRQITHQDVKPTNFLIRNSEKPSGLPDLLLADFGIAKFTMATMGESQTIRGTPAYMAPEQWSGNPVPASDQYALAIMAYELLTGQIPFRGNPQQVMFQHLQVLPQLPSQINPKLHADVDEVLLRALAKRPEDRFAPVSAFANSLQQALRKEPGLNEPTFVSPQYRPQSTPRDNDTVPVVKTRNVSKNLRILVLVLLTFFIVAGSIGLYSLFLMKRNSAANSTTPQTSGSSSKTNTPITPNATATTKDPYPPYNGTLILNDSLSDNTRGNDWNELMTSTYACKFEAGAYHIIQTQYHFFTDCFAEHVGVHFSNFTFQVQMKIIQGDCGGIVFRADSTENQFYFFRVCQNGFYDLRRFVDNTNQTARTLTSGFSSAIVTGINETNLVAVVAQGSELDLYVNQQDVRGITATAYSDGKIAVAASQNGNPTEVIFNNIMIWA
jgi:eukaryotic-like serine/threonine-protein kinase